MVVAKNIPQERMSERTIEQTDDVPVPQILEEIVEALTLVQPQTAEQTEDMLQFPQETSEMVRLASQERVRQRPDEHIVDESISQMTEENVEVVKIVPQKRISEGICEQVVDAPVPQVMNVPVLLIQEEIVEVIQLIQGERISEHIVEKIAADVLVPSASEHGRDRPGHGRARSPISVAHF